jgi:hypothetical protein
MKKKFLLFCVVLLNVLGIQAVTQIPITSTAGNDVWYAISCTPRGAADAKWLTGAADGGKLTIAVSGATATDIDAQRWKVVQNPNGLGIALQNKAYGTYLNSDLRMPTTGVVQLTGVSNPPLTTLKFVTSTPIKANSVYLVNYEAPLNADGTLDITAGNAYVFGFFSSNQKIPIANRGTDGNTVLLFVGEKDVLFDAITNVTAASLNQGTRSADVQNALLAAIAAANVVYNDPASTDANFSAATVALNAALVTYDHIFAPPTDGSYFYIQFTRGTNLVLQNNGSGTMDQFGFLVAGSNQLKAASLVIGSDAQLWRADPDPSNPGSYVFVSKAFDATTLGEVKIGWDATAARYIAVANDATGGLYTSIRGITTTAAYLPASVIMRSQNAVQAMNPVGGSNVGVAIGEFTKSDDGSAVRFVPESSTSTLLQSYITQANGLVASAAGNPGNHVASAVTTLNAATVAAQAVYNATNSTFDQIIAAANALNNAITAYNASDYIMPQISSADASNEKWYFFQGQRPANTYMTSNGIGANITAKIVIPDDTQLWKIVPNTNQYGTKDGYAFVNKVTGGYLNTDATNASNNAPIITLDTIPVKNVVINVSNVFTNGIARFWVENSGITSQNATGCNFRLHAGQTNVLNYFNDRGDNCAWLVMDYTVSLKSFLKDAITAANVVVNDVKHLGTAIGQHSVDAKATLVSAVAVAQALYDNASANDVDVKNAMKSLNQAVFVCKGTHGNAVVSTAANPRWFVIRNVLRPDAATPVKYVMSARGVLEGAGLKYEAQTNSNDQLWRFDVNPRGGVSIINAARPTLGIQVFTYNNPQKLVAINYASGYIIDSLGVGVRLTDSLGNSLHAYNGNLITWNDGAGTATNWTLEERTLPLFVPQTFTFDALPTKLTTDLPFQLAATSNSTSTTTYTSSNVSCALVEGTTVTIFGSGFTDITATNPGDATNASASVTQRLTVNLPDGIQNVTDGIRIEVKNRVITIIGTDAPFKVFAVTGVEVNAKRALTEGIYIVKVAGNTVKVNVR